MNGISLAVIIISGLIGLIILYKILKPYFIKHDSTMCFVGGLGSGKTWESNKLAQVLIRKQRIKYFYIFNFKRRIANRVRKIINYFHRKYNLKNRLKKGYRPKKIYQIKAYNKKPLLYANIPVNFRTHIFGFKREWNTQLKASHILCLEELREYSVVFIDELPQFINQFNWNQELIQKNVNEFITFFRHYIGGYLIVNAQAIDDVVVQIRRKLNQATWCFDFHVWPLPFLKLFYTVRMCDMMLSDQMQTVSTTYIEDNTKLHFGLWPIRKSYDTRCYSERYKNVLEKNLKLEKFKKLKTNKVLRLVKYTSPLDDTTTEQQQREQWKKGEEIWKN